MHRFVRVALIAVVVRCAIPSSLHAQAPATQPQAAAGSSRIRAMPWSPSFIEQARKKGGLEAVAGVGDEAYFYSNRNEYAEVYVKVGKHIVTLQSNLDGNLATVKPATFALAKALVSKLR